jgi:hypothetical protein
MREPSRVPATAIRLAKAAFTLKSLPDTACSDSQPDSDWEMWTGMVFPASRQFVVPDALNTVMVDRDADLVTYVEENLWVQHR